MAKIGDDSSDNQRIREVNEAELRNRIDREKRDQEVRVTKTFNQVMQDKSKRASAQKAGKLAANKDAGKEALKEKQVLNSLLKKSPKDAATLARRAALSHAMQSSLSKTRSSSSDELQRAQVDRSEDLIKKTDDDRELRDRDLHETEERDTLRAEERDVEHRRLHAGADNVSDQRAEERNGRRRDRDRGGEEDPRKAEGVQAAEAARGPHVPRISQEVIEKLVSAIYSAHTADGRTEMQIDLKGTMLEGVRLTVSAHNGKVRCNFDGCDRETKNLLEASKGALMRGLSKRGMTLVGMSVS